jgi:hypothetical protein
MYSSACFGRPHAHPQELINCRSSLWFYRWSVVVAVLLVVVGPAGPTTTNKLQVINLRNCCIWFVDLLKFPTRFDEKVTTFGRKKLYYIHSTFIKLKPRKSEQPVRRYSNWISVQCCWCKTYPLKLKMRSDIINALSSKSVNSVTIIDFVFWHVYVLGGAYFVWPWSPHRTTWCLTGAIVRYWYVYRV